MLKYKILILIFISIFNLEFSTNLPLYGQDWEKLRDSSNVLVEAGYLKDALDLSKDALEILKKQYGTRNPNYPKILSQIADIYYYLDNLNKSLEYYQLDSSSLKEIYGTENLEYALSLYNIAFVYSAKFQYEKAEPLLKDILQIKKTILGENNLEYASSLMDLALLNKNKGNYGEAESLY